MHTQTVQPRLKGSRATAVTVKRCFATVVQVNCSNLESTAAPQDDETVAVHVGSCHDSSVVTVTE